MGFWPRTDVDLKGSEQHVLQRGLHGQARSMILAFVLNVDPAVPAYMLLHCRRRHHPSHSSKSQSPCSPDLEFFTLSSTIAFNRLQSYSNASVILCPSSYNRAVRACTGAGSQSTRLGCVSMYMVRKWEEIVMDGLEAAAHCGTTVISVKCIILSMIEGTSDGASKAEHSGERDI